MSHRIIGTAGHIDHGKTALVKTLTGIDTDRLKEEKERAITIDLGFAFLDDTTAIVDVPGHERFVKNMVAGVTGIDLALLVIAADDGVMPQTREHIEIIRLLSIERLVVAITKIDLADDEWISLLHDEIDLLLVGNGYPDVPIILVSVFTGIGIEELKQTLKNEVAFVKDKNIDKPFRLPVDRSFIMKGFGTVVTGSVMSGKLKSDDNVELLPEEEELRLRGLQHHNETVETVQAGDRAALNFSGIQKEAIIRGNVVALKDSYHSSTIINCYCHFLKSSEKSLKQHQWIRFHCGTIETLGRINLLGKKIIEPGESTSVQFILEKPVVAVSGDRFIIRRYSPALTIGGGEIIEVDTQPAGRKWADVAAFIETLHALPQKDRVFRYVENCELEPVSSADLGKQFGLHPEQIDSLLSSYQNDIINFTIEKNQFWIHRVFFESACENIVRTIATYHQQNPEKPYLQLESLKSKIGSELEHHFLSRLFETLIKQKRIAIDHNRIRLSDFKPRFSEDLTILMGRFISYLEEKGHEGPTFDETSTYLGVNGVFLKKIIDSLSAEGEIVRVGELFLYKLEQINSIEASIRDSIKNEGSITVAGLRNILGTSRKYALPLLNYFDDAGITLRIGNKRVLK